MLRDDILRRRDGLRLYGLTPPKRRQDPDKVRDIAERQARRIAALAPDGLVLYDLQDEAGRTDAARPFPFLPTLEPLDYSRAYLAALDVPRVLYKCVGNQTAAELLAWVDALEAGGGRDVCVLVGAPTSAAAQGAGALGLSAAYDLLRARGAPPCLGGVAIAERHAHKLDEVSALRLRAALRARATRAGAVHPELRSVRLAQDDGVHEVARHLVPALARERSADRARHPAQVGRPRAADLRGRARLREGQGDPPRHQRRERVDPQGRDRGVGRAVSSAVGGDVARLGDSESRLS